MIAIGIIGLVLLAGILLAGIAQQLEQRTTRKVLERIEGMFFDCFEEWKTKSL